MKIMQMDGQERQVTLVWLGLVALTLGVVAAVVLSLMGFTIKTIIEARRSDRPTVHEVHPQMEPAD